MQVIVKKVVRHSLGSSSKDAHLERRFELPFMPAAGTSFWLQDIGWESGEIKYVEAVFSGTEWVIWCHTEPDMRRCHATFRPRAISLDRASMESAQPMDAIVQEYVDMGWEYDG